MTQLLQSSLAPGDFYAEFLQRLLAALRGVAGAVWGRTPQGSFHLQYQINLAEVGLDQVPHGRACHGELLRAAAERDRPLWAPPHSGPDTNDGKISAANLSSYGLLLAPILVDGEVAGLVEVWLDFYQDAQAWRGEARVLGEVAGFAAAYLHRNQLRHLQEQQRLWTQLEAYVRQVHGSLGCQETAYVVANQGRQLLGCEQVSVAVRTAGTVRVEAVSGASSVDRRSELVRRMQALFEAVLTWGEKLVFNGGRDASLPPAVLQALDAYLAESNCKLLLLLPLRDERDEGAGRCRAGLLAECFGPACPLEQLEQRAAVLAPHTASALNNAIVYSTVPLGWLSRPLGRTHTWLRQRGWGKVSLAAAAAGLLVAALVFVPAPLRLAARGQLLPAERQVVYAPLAGKVVEMKAQHGDRVERARNCCSWRTWKRSSRSSSSASRSVRPSTAWLCCTNSSARPTATRSATRASRSASPRSMSCARRRPSVPSCCRRAAVRARPRWRRRWPARW